MSELLLLDANLALLLVVGLTNERYIEKHKRLRSTYDKVDFDILKQLVQKAGRILFTPNVLTETSNLSRYIEDPFRTQIATVFAQIVSNVDERFIESKSAVRHAEHRRLGLTDAALLSAADSGATILTDDVDLYLAAVRAGLKAINYSHYREMRQDFQ